MVKSVEDAMEKAVDDLLSMSDEQFSKEIEKSKESALCHMLAGTNKFKKQE